MALAENPLSSAWSRHICVIFHDVRELLRTKKINGQFAPSQEQHENMLAKFLVATPCEFHRSLLLNTWYAVCRCGVSMGYQYYSMSAMFG